MRLLFYIIRNVLLTVFAVTLIIVLIDFIIGSVMQLNVVGMHGTHYYSFWDALAYIALRLPSDLYIFFPISTFLGTLIALNHLAHTSELTAMRAAGYSLWHFARALTYAGIILMFFYYALGFYIAPSTLHQSYLKRNFNSNNTSVLILANATWLRAGPHLLYIGQILPDGVMFNINDYIVQNGALTSIRQIAKAKINGNNWQLSGVKITHFTPQAVSEENLPSLTEPTLISTALLPAITMDMDEMTIQVLHDYIHYRKQNHLETRSYEVKFWGRIFQPIALIIMMLLALPFAFGSMRSNTMSLRLLGGLSLGFAFYIVNQFLSNITAVLNFSPFLAAVLPSLLFALLGCFLFMRLN